MSNRFQKKKRRKKRRRSRMRLLVSKRKVLRVVTQRTTQKTMMTKKTMTKKKRRRKMMKMSWTLKRFRSRSRSKRKRRWSRQSIINWSLSSSRSLSCENVWEAYRWMKHQQHFKCGHRSNLTLSALGRIQYCRPLLSNLLTGNKSQYWSEEGWTGSSKTKKWRCLF